MEKTRKNTLKIVFETAAKVPMYMDVLRFVGKTLKLSPASIHSIYKDENEQRFYIKFIDETSFNLFTRAIEEHYIFDYVDCSTAFVRLEVASSLFRYVRIFNLPPEIEDKEIAAALERYGLIRQHVREKYPADCGFVVFSGVRGVHMEISKELPASMVIGHCKARLYYDGLKNKCFHCKSEGHLKAECPKLAKLREAQNGDGSNHAGSFSQVLANATIGASHSPAIMGTNFTAFPVMGGQGKAGTSSVDKPIRPSGNQPNSSGSSSGTTKPPEERAEVASHSAADIGVKAKGDTTKRPPVSSPEKGSGSEEDKPPKKQPFVEPKQPESPIDALERRSRTQEREGRGSKSPRRSRSRNATK